MTLSLIPLAAALLPAVAVHLCYGLAAYLGHVPWCMPYVDGCVSISAAGRHIPEVHIFRPAMICTGVLMAAVWWLGREWLAMLGSRWRTVNGAMAWFGIAAALGLIVYATVLGSIGPEYRLQRRIGVTVFYGFTFLAQLLMTVQLRPLGRARPGALSVGVIRGAEVLCMAFAAGGLLSLALWGLWDGYRRLEDAFEWSLTLLLLLHFLAIHQAWRSSGFRAGLTMTRR